MLPGLLSWLVQHRSEYGISDQQIWWFVLEAMEDPVQKLVRVYDTNPDWQKYFPDAFSPSGWKRFTRWVRDRYGFDVTAQDFQLSSAGRPLQNAILVDRGQRSCDGTLL
jgi:hypothetical protein